MKPGFLSAGQETVTVFDGSCHYRQPVGFEFGQADNDVRLQNRPRETYRLHIFRVKINFLSINTYIPVVAPGSRHQASLYETLLVGAITENARIIPHDN